MQKSFRPLLWGTVGGLLILAALSGCAPDTSAPDLNQAARDERVRQTQAGPPATPIALVPEATVLAMATPNTTDAICLDCHSNEELLRELAVEDEEPESLSSGPG